MKNNPITPLFHLALLFALAAVLFAGCQKVHAQSLPVENQVATNALSFDLTRLVPTSSDLLAKWDASVGIGYNTSTHSGVQDFVIDASLAPALNIGVVGIHDRYGWSGGAFSFNVTGHFWAFDAIAGAGPGYDWQLKRTMAYMFIGVGYPIRLDAAGKFTITPSVEMANMSTRPGNTFLVNLTFTF